MAMVAAALEHARPVELRGDDLVIAFPAGDAFFAGQVKSAECRERVGEALQAVTGRALRPDYELRELEPTDEPAPPPSDDEWVDRFKSAFNAEEIEAS
jgi:hypothetical protein